ncbi:SAM-dependent methyltransferase [Nocardia colli]|uniref:SAM-dependent methyltransferase n=1 Tax=Nocardia colli TaxID=2545717 RepID=UPI00168D6CF9|nr:SAM-dependent methyltransferase [Nocardia colli]
MGATALVVAAARAIETATPDGSVRDPYAAAFVRIADPTPSMPVVPSEPEDIWTINAPYFGVRSRYFDDYITRSGCGQIVDLAAGLDTRAYRLTWNEAATFYELDRHGVLDFKQRVLDILRAEPYCRRRPVPVEFAEEWVSALIEAGFAPEEPTVWIAEGLLNYLPPDAQEALFEGIDEHSAAGSRVAVEVLGERGNFQDIKASMGIDLEPMLNATNRTLRPEEWFRRHGWQVTEASALDLFDRYQRAPNSLLDPFLYNSRFFTAHKVAATHDS